MSLTTQNKPSWSTCCTCGYRWQTGRNGSHSCAEQLRAELDIADKLINERNRLLAEIPECPVHGPGCVPHAIEWVKAAKIIFGGD